MWKVAISAIAVLITALITYTPANANENPLTSADTFVLVKPNTINTLPANREFQFYCNFPIDVFFVGKSNYEIRYTFQADGTCEEIFEHDFSNVMPVANIPLQLDNLSLHISNMSVKSTYRLLLHMFNDQQPSDKDNCGDPGTGVFIPSIKCPGIVIADPSNFGVTRIANCIGKPDNLPNDCARRSVVGHTVYALRLSLPDLGDNKEQFSQVQATTINTMGDDLSAYKNLIISLSKYPGDFAPENPKCKDITASENSDVVFIQANSDIALQNPGRYCTYEPNQIYYINSRLDAGLSANCGKLVDGAFVTCTYDVVQLLAETL